MFCRILSICLTVLLLFGLLPIGNVSAQGSNDYDMTASVEGGTIYFNSSTHRTALCLGGKSSDNSIN